MRDEQRAKRQEARPADPRLLPGHCHKCGNPRVDNPHPDAGKPGRYLEVGCEKECLPCMVLSRHQWVQRAMKAENQLRHLIESKTVILDEALRVFEQAACQDTYKMREGIEAVLQYAAASSQNIVGEKFTRAWINLDELPGGMMQSSEVGRFGPVAASTSCWITTSEKEAERLREKGPVLEIFTHPAKTKA